MKRMTIARPGPWGMGSDLPDARSGACITDVVIKRLHDAIRILRLKRTLKPSSGRSAPGWRGAELHRSSRAAGKGGFPCCMKK